MKKEASQGLSFILPVFFLSGAAGGIYEIVWTKQLLLVFGSSAFAISTVLTVYMAGLAIGSYYVGKHIDKKPEEPIRLFAHLELGVGIFGLVLLFVIPLINKLYYLFYLSLFLKNIIRFILCFVILLPPTILMGGTLPVLSKGCFSGERFFSRNVGRLYAVNTIGAMSGIFIVGFFLLPMFGVISSTITAIFFNVVVAVIALFISSRFKSSHMAASEKDDRIEKEEKYIEKRLNRDQWLSKCLLLSVAGIAGFTSMSYEVIYTRLLKLVFHNTIYGFTTILVAFLAGIGFGSLIASKFSDRLKNGFISIGLIQLSLGILAIWTMPIIYNLSSLMQYVYEIFISFGWSGYALSRFTVSCMVLIGVSGLSGATFPIVIKLMQIGKQSPGTRVGEVYSVNTIGAVAGSFAGGFIILPAIGSYWGLIVLAVLNISIGVLCVYNSKISVRNWRPVIIVSGLFLFCISLALNPKFVFLGNLEKPGQEVKIIHVDEGATASVYILQKGKTGQLMLYTNGIGAIGNDYPSLQTVRLLGHLPALLCKKLENALVIGFGTGKTLSSVAKHPVKSIDCVEIVPEVVESAHYFKNLNENVLSDSRVNIVLDDGRSFLFGTNKKYDIISCDPIHPAYGSASLYTREYFLECYNKLNEGGVTVQYLPFHHLSPYDFAVLINTFSSVFPDTSIWFAFYHGILVGRKNEMGQDVDMNIVKQRLNVKSVIEDLKKSNIENIDGLLSRMIVGADLIKEIVKNVNVMNTDNNSILEFSESRYLAKGDTWIKNMENMIPYMRSVPYEDLFDASTIDEKLKGKFLYLYRARIHAMLSRLYYEKGMLPETVFESLKQMDLINGDLEAIYSTKEVLRLYINKLAKQPVDERDAAVAIKILEKAISTGFESVDILTILGELYISVGQTGKAIESLQKALRKDPTHEKAIHMMGKVKLLGPAIKPKH